MKIKFVGLRGFSDDSSFIDIRDLTVLTGKNSSGKSTLIKLLKLFSAAFTQIKTFDDLMDVKIDIATDELGGKDKMLSLVRSDNLSMIMITDFEIFVEDHEVHIDLNLTDWQISVKQVSIFSLPIKEDDAPLLFVKNKQVRGNVYRLRNYYLQYAPVFNYFETLRYQDEYSGGERLDEFDTVPSDIVKRFEGDNTYYERHKMFLKGEKHFIDLDFRAQAFGYRELADFEFFQLNTHIDNLEFSEVDVLETLESISEGDPEDELFHNYTHLDYYIHEYIEAAKKQLVNFDFAKSTIQYLEKNLNSFFASTDALTEHGRMSLWHWTMQNIDFDLFPHLDNQEGENLSCSSIGEFFDIMLAAKHDIYFPLIKGFYKIFQHRVISQLNYLGTSQFQSNLRVQTERTYNIFDRKNTFSIFLKSYSVLNEEDKKNVKDFILQYLTKFHIADNIEIDSRDNAGFIYLYRGRYQIPLIDEGSGISNIIALLLFLSVNSRFTKQENDLKETETIEPRIVVIEEPESNLHPNLQSLLADLFIDIVKNNHLHLIVETHSEYLIRKLQYLVSKGEISHEKLVINFFSLNYNDQHQPFIKTKIISIEVDGALSDSFDPGFLDEADNLAIDLFTLNQNRQN